MRLSNCILVLLLLMSWVAACQAANIFNGLDQAVVIEGDRASAELLSRNVTRAQALGNTMEHYVESGRWIVTSTI